MKSAILAIAFSLLATAILASEPEQKPKIGCGGPRKSNFGGA
jgi:hypothetical protein